MRAMLAAVLVAPSLVKVRPVGPLPAHVVETRTLELEAARGECEAAHVVVAAGARPLTGVRASVRPGPVPLTLYREAFLEVRTPSNVEGDTGPWPDALVPDVDPVAGERRNAFPFDVPAGRRQPLLVEACVPVDAAPGLHVNTVHITGSELDFTLTVQLRVHAAQLPEAGTFPATFGLSGRSVMLGHHARPGPDDERRRLVERYARLALRYRIGLHAMTRIPPAVRRDGGRMSVDFDAWDRELAPFMDGPRRFALFDLRLPDDLPRADWNAYGRLVAGHFAARGWGERLFAYVMDEPKPSERGELEARLDALEGTGIPRLVTMPLDDGLAGRVELWAPNLNCLFHKRRRGEYCAGERPREDYRARESRGDRLFWYVSCSSHGCGHGPFGDARDDYFRGWPSYVVDADGASARIMGWLAFAHGIGGELHFDTVYAYRGLAEEPRRDPWDDLWAFGGNGDGTLFYPGRPDRIGGRTHVPVASLRLVHVRDGVEDLELLRLLAARGPRDAKLARELANSLAASPHGFAHDPARFAEARAALLRALDRPPAR
jgi:hypothetical protein